MEECKKKKGKKLPFKEMKNNFTNSLYEVESFLRKSDNIFKAWETGKFIKSISSKKNN